MVRFAVLGCGRIGRMHARNLAGHARAELVSVFDTQPAASREVAAAFGVPAAASADAILADSTVRAVLIATPTDTHVPLIIAAAKAGKAVLCEKPIDLDLARAEACWREIKPLHPTVMIGFNRRFDPSFRSLRDRIGQGEIGALEQVVITSRDPAPPPAAYIKTSGGLFRDMTIHDFDMARYLAGEVVEVQAFGSTLVDPAIAELGDIDGAMVTLRAGSGALVQIINSRRCAYGYDQRVEAFGALGMLQAANRTATTVEAWTASGTAAREPVLNFFIERYGAAYVAEIDNFVSAVEGEEVLLSTFDDGLQALRLADAAAESLRTGRAVKVA